MPERNATGASSESETLYPTDAPEDGELRLVVVGSPVITTHVLPSSGELLVGREPGVHVLVDDPTVSRRHALIRIGRVLEIEDLGSANGTFVNQTRVVPGKRAKLEPRDLIRVGNSSLLLVKAARSHPPSGRDGPIIESPAMRALFAAAARIAAGPINVLVLGETGSGKEVVARAIHDRSPRAKGPFVAINCGAVAESLLENELFGHEPGAFTGASSSKPGLIETASGGTLFLDEVGDMPASLQQKLLRVLEEGAVLRLGATKTRAVDVRFVAATNKDILSLVESGAFRRDLYFRLCGTTLYVPPLRERVADVKPLATYFLERFAARARRPLPRLSEAALAALEKHAWPGNVRELRNNVERAALLANETIEVEHLQLGAPAARPAKLRDELESVEAERMRAALAQHQGNQTHAAATLGMSRRSFVMKMDRYGIPRPHRQPRAPAEPEQDAATWVALPIPREVCRSCGKPLGLATLTETPGPADTCAACREASTVADVSGVAGLLSKRLEEEGFTVVARLSPEPALAPVFRVKRPRLGDEVALKVLPLYRDLSPKKLERFKTEAWAMAQIKHPSVVRVHDVKERPDLTYLVMEFIEGETLQQRLERLGALVPREVVRIGLAIAKALEVAARHGIVHRNLKPANVMISAEDGRPKLIDFALAKGVAASGPGITAEGETLGTIRYMAPEQLKDARIADQRSDVYGLGATLFHAATGKVPYADRSDVDIVKRAVSGQLPALVPDASVEEPLRTLVGRMLSLDPTARPDIVELVAAFGAMTF